MKNFQIAGNLGTAPELQTKGDTVWTQLWVACNGKDLDWFNVVVFGKLAENCCEYLGKGDGVAIAGRLRSEKYEGKHQIKMIADTVQFFSKRKAEEDEE